MTASETEATNDTLRSVELTRLGRARYVATNRRGGTLEVGEGDDDAFSPVELLLTAIAACTAMDVDYIVGKRAEADSGHLRSSAHKVRDEHGNHLVDLDVRFDLRYPEGEAGDAARDVLPLAIQRSLGRLCTVARTVQLGAPVLGTVAAPADRPES